MSRSRRPSTSKASLCEQSPFGRRDEFVHEFVDDDVLFHEAFGQFTVVREQGVRRSGDCLSDQGEDLHRLGT